MSKKISKIASIFNSHDASFCILENGKPVIHAEYERYLRLKEPKGDSLKFMKEVVDIDDIDIIVGSGKDSLPSSEIDKNTFFDIGHHKCHAANTFFSSNIDKSLIITIDGGGWEGDKDDYIISSLTFWYGEGNKVYPLKIYERSAASFTDTAAKTNLGGLWNNYTCKVFNLSVGYPHGAQMGTVMAMAAYGDKNKYIDEMLSGVYTFKDKFLKELPRGSNPKDKRYFDVAAGLQHWTEIHFKKIIQEGINLYREKLGVEPENLCLAGGVVLNSVCTGKLWDWFSFKDIYVTPCPGDSGITLGAAQYYWHQVLDNPRIEWKDNFTPYLGQTYSKELIYETLNNDNRIVDRLNEVNCTLHYRDVSDDDVIDLLESQHIVSVYGGGSESGRRALGNRSILADPRSLEMKDMINEKVKHRQWFRPFAPSILREEVKNWFEKDVSSPYMEYVINVKEEMRDKVQAIVHDNGTARLQTVTENDNKWYYNFISKFKEKTGVPILLNTSFNDREPIVETPFDAVNCFLGTNIDAVYFRDAGILVTKEDK